MAASKMVKLLKFKSALLCELEREGYNSQDVGTYSKSDSIRRTFVFVEMIAKPEVYLGLSKIEHTEASAKIAAKVLTQLKRQTNEKIIDQINIVIRMRRQLELDVNKTVLVMNMPVDEIALIFKYEPQPKMTAEFLLPIFKQYVTAKQANPKIDPMIWEYIEPK
jgi:hypothetical protein